MGLQQFLKSGIAEQIIERRCLDDGGSGEAGRNRFLQEFQRHGRVSQVVVDHRCVVPQVLVSTSELERAVKVRKRFCFLSQHRVERSHIALQRGIAGIDLQLLIGQRERFLKRCFGFLTVTGVVVGAPQTVP